MVPRSERKARHAESAACKRTGPERWGIERERERARERGSEGARERESESARERQREREREKEREKERKKERKREKRLPSPATVSFNTDARATGDAICDRAFRHLLFAACASLCKCRQTGALSDSAGLGHCGLKPDYGESTQ